MKRGTSEHPKTRRLMALLGIDRAKAVGTLHLLWEAAGQHTPQGDIGRWPDEDIALAAGWDGDARVLIDTLVTCRWLDNDTTARLVIHDFEDHAEEAVKKRLARNGLKFLKGDGGRRPDKSRHVATRPDKSRHGSTALASASASAFEDPCVLPASEGSADPSGYSHTRSLALAAPAPVLDLRREFERFWKLYPKRRKKPDAWKAWQRIKLTAELIETIHAAVKRWAPTPEWQKEGGQFVPNPTTWLRAEGWNDELTVADAADPEREKRLQAMNSIIVPRKERS